VRTVLVVDNYDSFTYNLVQLLMTSVAETANVVVVRNNTHTVDALLAMKPWRVVISPGPGAPSHAGVSNEIIARCDVPLLGVCLGHQCIASVFGARVLRGSEPVHGKPSEIYHNGSGIFSGIASPFVAGRYHSLAVEEHTVPECLEVTARTKDGVIMGLQHKTRPIVGVQFHPESVLTPSGADIVRNFLRDA
jgi:anthranilate synthase component II